MVVLLTRCLVFVVDKVRECLSGWSVNKLSFEAQVTFIKSVLSALPSYIMQIVPLPLNLCSEIDKIIRKFLWGNSVDTKKVHLVKWDTVCKDKESYGVGIHPVLAFNQAYMVKPW